MAKENCVNNVVAKILWTTIITKKKFLQKSMTNTLKQIKVVLKCNYIVHI